MRHVDEHDVIAIAVDVIAKKTIERLPRGGRGIRGREGREGGSGFTIRKEEFD